MSRFLDKFTSSRQGRKAPSTFLDFSGTREHDHTGSHALLPKASRPHSPLKERILGARKKSSQGPIIPANASPLPASQAMSRAISDNLMQHPKLTRKLGMEMPPFLPMKMHSMSSPELDFLGLEGGQGSDGTGGRAETSFDPQGTLFTDSSVNNSPSFLFLHVDPCWDPRQGAAADVFALPPLDKPSTDHSSRFPRVRGRSVKSKVTQHSDSFLTME